MSPGSAELVARVQRLLLLLDEQHPEHRDLVARIRREVEGRVWPPGSVTVREPSRVGPGEFVVPCLLDGRAMDVVFRLDLAVAP